MPGLCRDYVRSQYREPILRQFWRQCLETINTTRRSHDNIQIGSRLKTILGRCIRELGNTTRSGLVPFQVLRGGDRKVAFALRDNHGAVLQSEEDREEYFFEKNIEDEGE